MYDFPSGDVERDDGKERGAGGDDGSAQNFVYAPVDEGIEFFIQNEKYREHGKHVMQCRYDRRDSEPELEPPRHVDEYAQHRDGYGIERVLLEFLSDRGADLRYEVNHVRIFGHGSREYVPYGLLDSFDVPAPLYPYT